MKKLFILVACFLSFAAGAQTYPSPTYNNLSVVGGSLNVTGDNPSVSISDNLLSGGTTQLLIKDGIMMWGLTNIQAPNRFSVERYINGVYTDSPLFFDGSSGLLHAPDGATITGLTASTALISGLAVTGTTTIGGPTTISGNTTISGPLIANNNFTMHAPVLVSFAGAVAGINDTSGTSNAQLIFANNGPYVWGLNNYSGSNLFSLDRYVNGADVDSPITVSNSSGLVSLADGVSTSTVMASAHITEASANPRVVINDTSGSGFSAVQFESSSTTGWDIGENNGASNAFQINRYVGGVSTDAPISISQSTGIVGFPNGWTAAKQASLQYAGPTLVLNDTSGTSQNTIAFQSASTNEWQLLSDTSQLRIARFVSNAFVDNPLLINNASGAVAIKGTSTDDTAAAGYVGEFLKNHSVNTNVPSGTITNCGSLSLPPGDWDVWGNIEFTPSGTTTWNGISSALSFVSAQEPGEEYQNNLNSTFSNSAPSNLLAMMQPLQIGSTTIVYIVGTANFTGGTVECDGYLEARRRR